VGAGPAANPATEECGVQDERRRLTGRIAARHPGAKLWHRERRGRWSAKRTNWSHYRRARAIAVAVAPSNWRHPCAPIYSGASASNAPVASPSATTPTKRPAGRRPDGNRRASVRRPRDIRNGC